MHQAFHARLQLYEGAVVGDVGDPAGELGLQGVFGLDPIPGIGQQLFHAKADTLGFRINADHLNLDGFADSQGLGRVVDPAPGHVGDMQQAVDAAQVHEGAVIGDVLDHAFQHLAFGQIGHQFGALHGQGDFQNGPAGDHYVAPASVHLQDLKGLRDAHQWRDIANGTDVDLATRQECHGA